MFNIKNKLVFVLFSLFSSGFAIADSHSSLSGVGGLGGGLPFLFLMFILMYFLLIRPQQKRAKEHKNLQESLKKDDEIVTNGGLVGKIVKVEENFIDVEIAKSIVVKVQKQGINNRTPKGTIKLK